MMCIPYVSTWPTRNDPAKPKTNPSALKTFASARTVLVIDSGSTPALSPPT